MILNLIQLKQVSIIWILGASSNIFPTIYNKINKIGTATENDTFLKRILLMVMK